MALTIVYGVLVIGGICLLSLGGLELVERLVPAHTRQQHNDVAGFIYAPCCWRSWLSPFGRAFRRPMRQSTRRQTLWPRSSGWRLEPEGTHIQQL